MDKISPLKSRIEFPPLVEDYVDSIKGEPIKNNVAFELFGKVLLVVLSKCSFSKTAKFNELSESSVLVLFTNFARYKMGCAKLARKLRKRFDESKSDGAFVTRFTGKEF